MTNHIKKCFKCPKGIQKNMDIKKADIFPSEATVEAAREAQGEVEETESSSNQLHPQPQLEPRAETKRSDSVTLTSISQLDCTTPTSSGNASATPVSDSVSRQSRPCSSLSSYTGNNAFRRSIHSFLDTMTVEENKKLNHALAKAIYISGSPLSLVEHPLWIEFFQKLRQSFKPPTRKCVSTTLLDQQYSKMKTDLSSDIAGAKNLHLQCDGWSNVRHESIVNFMISKPEPVFIESIATEENRHTGEYLCEIMSGIIEKYNPEKFLVVIGDNAANMKKAFTLLHEKYDHLVPLGCVCHTLQLLCNDIVNCRSSQIFLNNCTQIVKCIKNVHILNALFMKINKTKNISVSLKLPVKTRWGSFLDTLQSLFTCKSTLQTLAVNEQAADCLPKEIKSRILDDNIFWVQVEKLILILKPIVSLIKKFESNECLIHTVHHTPNEFQKTLTDLLPQSPLSKAEEAIILKNTEERIRMALSPIHLAAALLDPSDQGCHLTGEEHVDAVEFIHKLAEKMNIVTPVSCELASYIAKDGLWGKQFLWISVGSVTLIVWWKGICKGSRLSEVAQRILSAPVSSAATERSFSTFSWIHNKKRNRLTNKRAGKITYLSHNWKLLQQIKRKTFTEPDYERTENKSLPVIDTVSASQPQLHIRTKLNQNKRKIGSNGEQAKQVTLTENESEGNTSGDSSESEMDIDIPYMDDSNVDSPSYSTGSDSELPV